ncbi:MAG: purine-nucleoside phosphorylase [Alphaproteobacteria bacterium]|nr:purine-nucleoside phosphorylase [Alphaproteobacteria bacterium]
MSQDLYRAALAIRERAYAPYSNYKVGAAIRGAGGGIFVGANVENAAYPQGNCAETSAIAAMIAAGETRIAEVAVIGTGKTLCTPCGGCRQRLREFAAESAKIHLCGDRGIRKTVTLKDLLPLSFGPEHLGETAPAEADAAKVIRARAPKLKPKAVLILGSGLGPVADAIEGAVAIPYKDLPGFPTPSIEGHAGRLLLGRLGGVAVAAMQGRVHLYEGASADAMTGPLRLFRRLGAKTLIATNAAGGLNPDWPPSTLMAIADQINLTGRNPLTGPNDEAVGPRFPDMTEAYDRKLLKAWKAAAKKSRVPVEEGVYLCVPGPSYETPAEIRAFRALGADAVGMSTVLEVIAARHAGYRCAGLSIITNLAAGLSDAPLNHEDVVAAGRGGAKRLVRLLSAFLEETGG